MTHVFVALKILSYFFSVHGIYNYRRNVNDFHFGKNNFSSVFDLLACNSIKGEEKIENLSKKT